MTLNGRVMVVSGSEDKTLRLWDPENGATLQVRVDPEGHTDRVWCVASCSIDGRGVVVSGGFDKTVRVWAPVVAGVVAPAPPPPPPPPPPVSLS